jgi:hypothetical protein
MGAITTPATGFGGALSIEAPTMNRQKDFKKELSG